MKKTVIAFSSIICSVSFAQVNVDFNNLGFFNTVNYGSIIEGDHPSRRHPNYDYAATVMIENGVYRIWYLGRAMEQAPDFQEDSVRAATSQDGLSWSTPQIVLAPQSPTPGEAGYHLGNPSVIKVDNLYHMYFSNGRGDKTVNDQDMVANNVGYATSSDGQNFTYHGDIIKSFKEWVPTGTQKYGAGLPSVVYKDGIYYMVYNDTVGQVAQSNGSGLFLIRSNTPNFSSNVEVFDGQNFIPMTQENKTKYLFEANVDGGELAYSPALGMWVLKAGAQDNLRFFSEDFQKLGDIFIKEIALGFLEEDTMARTPHGFLPGNSLPLTIDIYPGFTDSERAVNWSDHDAVFSDLQRMTFTLGDVRIESEKDNDYFRIELVDADCSAGYARIAFLGSMHLLTDSIGPANEHHKHGQYGKYYNRFLVSVEPVEYRVDPRDWALCAKKDSTGAPLVTLKHESNDCDAKYTRVAWLGGVHAIADGFDFTNGPQNWALCSRLLDGEPIVTIKHFQSSCPANYTVNALIAHTHMGADGYNFQHGPQDWYSCTNLNEKVEGCTNPVATNFDPLANFDNGSCAIAGCTDSMATNYNSSATVDDGSCTYTGVGPWFVPVISLILFN